MKARPVSFRVCDFSEQVIPPSPGVLHYIYSSAVHVDGRVYNWRKAIRPEFAPPLSALRSEGWLALLEQIAKERE